MKVMQLSNISGLFLVATSCGAFAQAVPVTQPASNDQVLQNWQQSNIGGQSAAVVKQEDGSTKIEWKGSITANVYNNNITSASGSTNTALASGDFFKSVISNDLRAITPGGQVNYLQFGITHSNDRSVLSAFPRQINNIQVGHTGPGYMLALGDVAPNFSSLGSALGLRGAIGQYKLGDVTVYGYGGVVAESWEALENNVVRNQFVRDVAGIKLEYAVTPALKIYATSQHAADQANSITNSDAAAYALPAHIMSKSMGFQYVDGGFQIAGETASSGYRQATLDGRSGQATILDGTWRGQSVSLRGGYHNIDPKFVSLAASAAPGVKEIYAGGDWTAARWVTLTADLRNSKNSTLASEFAPSTTTSTDSGTLRANINFGPDLPGWGLSLQGAESRTVDPSHFTSRNTQTSATLNYASQQWNTGFGYAVAKVRSQASPTSDSDTASWNINLGRTFNDATGSMPATWTLNVSLVAALQFQHMIAGSDTQNINYSLNVAGQRTGWGNFTLQLTDGYITRPGQSDLKSRAAQFDATYSINALSSLKFYYRKALRNINDPVSGATERVGGLQLTYGF